MNENPRAVYVDENDRAMEPGGSKGGAMLHKTAAWAAAPVGGLVASNTALPWYLRAGGAIIGLSGVGRWLRAGRKVLGRVDEE